MPGGSLRLSSRRSSSCPARASTVPCCLVLDVTLPGLNGLELQQRLTQRTEMPIIFITGYGDVPMSVRAMKAGATEFLTKPFKDEVLLDAIRHAIDRSRDALREESEMHVLRTRYASLTPREREVMALVVQRVVEQAGRRRTRHQRDHREGASRSADAKDAGRLTGRSRDDGGQAWRANRAGVVSCPSEKESRP